MHNNINGIKSKQKSLKDIIEEENPTIIGISETKLTESDSLTLDGYIIKRVDRESGGGGVLIAYKRCLENVMMVVREEKRKEEMLWIKVDNGKMKMRIGIVYMPQENETKLEEIKEIYSKIEEEIMKADDNNEVVVLMGDLNCKIGNHIEKNTDEVSKGGRVLLKMCNKMDLAIVNGKEFCKGTWTRIQKEQKSVLDYMIMKNHDVHHIEKMVIDENKIKTPYRITSEKELIYTDHCMMITTMKFQMQGEKMKPKKYLSQKGYMISSK